MPRFRRRQIEVLRPLRVLRTPPGYDAAPVFLRPAKGLRSGTSPARLSFGRISKRSFPGLVLQL